MISSFRGGYAAFAVALLVTACSSASDSSAPVAAAGQAQIRLGAFLPITGPYAEIGESDLAAQQMAVAEINAAGGVLGRKISLQSIDGGCDPALTVAAVEQLIRDKVAATVGGICSAALTNAMPILRKAGMVHVEPGANSTDLLKDPYSGLFLLMGTVADEAKAANPWLDNLKVRHPIIVHDGTSFSFTLAQSARSEFDKSTHPALAVLEITQAARTYAPTVKRIMSSKADAVFFTGYYAEAGILVKDLRNAGFNGKIFLGDGSADLAILDGATAENLKNVYFITPPMPPITVSARDWVKRYRAANDGAAPRAFSMQSYTAVMAVADAIERAGTTESVKLAEALRSTSFVSPYGEIRFDKRQVASTAFNLVTISDGTFKAMCLAQCS